MSGAAAVGLDPQHLGGHRDRRQRLVEFVRQTGSHFTECRDATGMGELGHLRAPLGHISPDRQDLGVTFGARIGARSGLNQPHPATGMTLGDFRDRGAIGQREVHGRMNPLQILGQDDDIVFAGIELLCRVAEHRCSAGEV